MFDVLLFFTSRLSYLPTGNYAESDFLNTFRQRPENAQISAEHRFSGSKALLLSRKSIALLQKKRCSIIFIDKFCGGNQEKVF